LMLCNGKTAYNSKLKKRQQFPYSTSCGSGAV
jgi:hypothetical protein